MSEDPGNMNPEFISELNARQVALQSFLDNKHDEIFTRFSRDRDFVALTESPPDNLHLHFFYTKEELINFLMNKVTFAYDCRDSSQRILMF
jgi:hypothetical protein